MIGRFLCRLGLHRWDYCGNAYRHAPAPIRCERCRKPYAGDPYTCAGCGGDGVQIDDDPESTRQIVRTCVDCGGIGSADPSHAPSLDCRDCGCAPDSDGG